MDLTSSGLTATALAMTVAVAVTVCTALVVVIGVLIDRSAASHERAGGK